MAPLGQHTTETTIIENMIKTIALSSTQYVHYSHAKTVPQLHRQTIKSSI